MFERDPRQGKGIHLHLTPDGAWPELKRRSYWRASDISMVSIQNGTRDGHAAVVIRFDTEDKKVIIGQMTLRELHATFKAIVAAHGEPWMQETNESLERLKQDLIIAELAKQLTALQVKSGMKPTLDMSAADAEFDRLSKNMKGKA